MTALPVPPPPLGKPDPALYWRKRAAWITYRAHAYQVPSDQWLRLLRAAEMYEGSLDQLAHGWEHP